MSNTRQIGNEKENIAAKYLQDKGYFIVKKNYRVRQGEIDIVARDKSTLVFVEVKYRKNATSGHPLEAVNYKKQKQITKTAMFYMVENKITIDNTPIRFDVIGILGDKIEHIENAFEAVL